MGLIKPHTVPQLKSRRQSKEENHKSLVDSLNYSLLLLNLRNIIQHFVFMYVNFTKTHAIGLASLCLIAANVEIPTKSLKGL